MVPLVTFYDGHESILSVIAHSNTNRHSVSHFPYKCIVISDTLTYINTSSDCFPERTVTLDTDSTITCQVITLVSLLCSLA